MDDSNKQDVEGSHAEASADKEASTASSASTQTKTSLIQKLFGSRKKKLVTASLILVLLLGGSAGWRLFGDTESEAPLANTNVRLGIAVSVVDGTAKFSKDGSTWTTLSTDTQLVEGDIVATESASRVILALDDGSAVRLDELTTVELSSLVTDDIRIENQSGSVYSRVVPSDRKYTVEVENVDYTALGTAFNTINKPSDKGVVVVQSSVAVENSDQKVDEGKQFYKVHTNTDWVDKVTDVSVDEVKSSSFMVWNMEKDEQHDQFKDKLGYWTKVKEANTEEAEEPAPPAGASIKLAAKNTDKGTVLSWSLSGVSAPDGFKVVRSKKSSNPVYGKDEANYVGSKERSYTWKSDYTAVFHYRVCIYTGKTCSLYSNSVQIESQAILPEKPISGTVTLAINSATASWTYTGTAPHGFKVNVSASPNPTYGGEATKSYYTDSPYSFNMSELQTKLGAGPYYVRVCKYTASSKVENGCMDYSNQLTLEAE